MPGTDARVHRWIVATSSAISGLRLIETEARRLLAFFVTLAEIKREEEAFRGPTQRHGRGRDRNVVQRAHHVAFFHPQVVARVPRQEEPERLGVASMTGLLQSLDQSERMFSCTSN